MLHAVKMPKLGAAMTEGTLLEWAVEEGGYIEEGDELAVVEIEKTTAEVEAPVSGLVKRLVAAPEESVPVGGLIAVLGSSELSVEEVSAFISAFRAKHD